jgi:hypothetical protein
LRLQIPAGILDGGTVPLAWGAELQDAVHSQLERRNAKVTIVRISVDLPAPFGPSSPYMPRGMDSVTWSRARVPLA